MAARQPDWYGELGVAPTATPREVRAAFRALAKKLHPDAGGDAGDSARFQRVVEAYDVLRQPHTRAAYDAARSGVASGGAGSAVPLTPVYDDPAEIAYVRDRAAALQYGIRGAQRVTGTFGVLGQLPAYPFHHHSHQPPSQPAVDGATVVQTMRATSRRNMAVLIPLVAAMSWWLASRVGGSEHYASNTAAAGEDAPPRRAPPPAAAAAAAASHTAASGPAPPPAPVHQTDRLR